MSVHDLNLTGQNRPFSAWVGSGHCLALSHVELGDRPVFRQTPSCHKWPPPILSRRDRATCASGVLSISHLNPFHSILCGTDACGALRAGLTLQPSCLRTTDATVARGARRNSGRPPVRWIVRQPPSDRSTPNEMPASCWPAGPHKTCSNRRDRPRCRRRLRMSDLVEREAEP